MGRCKKRKKNRKNRKNKYKFGKNAKMGAVKKSEFFVNLCNDVLHDLLRFGNRCDLATIESSGQRYHHAIKFGLRKAPFLLLKMQLNIGYVLTLEFGNLPVNIILVNLPVNLIIIA